MLPNGGTAPLRHLVISHTYYSLAISICLLFSVFLTCFHDNFLAADITHNANSNVRLLTNNMALAPLAKLTPLT